jgi:hypothetical protein
MTHLELQGYFPAGGWGWGTAAFDSDHDGDTDLVAVMALLALALTGLVTPTEALAGLSDPVVVMIAALFVVGEGLYRTGMAERMARLPARFATGDPDTDDEEARRPRPPSPPSPPSPPLPPQALLLFPSNANDPRASPVPSSLVKRAAAAAEDAASDGDDENDLRDNGTWARLTCGPSLIRCLIWTCSGRHFRIINRGRNLRCLNSSLIPKKRQSQTCPNLGKKRFSYRVSATWTTEES